MIWSGESHRWFRTGDRAFVGTGVGAFVGTGVGTGVTTGVETGDEGAVGDATDVTL